MSNMVYCYTELVDGLGRFEICAVYIEITLGVSPTLNGTNTANTS